MRSLPATASMGALLYGDPRSDTLVVNHCKCWLPTGEPEILPKMAHNLTEMRRIIGEKDYGDGENYFTDKAQAGGWSGHLIWTDAYHPGFILKLEHAADWRDHELRPRGRLFHRRSADAVAHRRGRFLAPPVCFQNRQRHRLSRRPARAAKSLSARRCKKSRTT